MMAKTGNRKKTSRRSARRKAPARVKNPASLSSEPVGRGPNPPSLQQREVRVTSQDPLADLSDADREVFESISREWRLTESLFSGLELATRKYEKDQRAAWSFAVATVVNFLKKIGVEPRLLRPLGALHSAVDDLRYGIVDEGLKPAPFEGGPRVPTNKFLHYVMAAVTVTLLHEDDNSSLDEALTEASKLSGIPKTTLAQFRKNTAAGRRSWKANAFYWIELRHVRRLFAAPKQRVGYMREWFRNKAPLPKKVP
jgi:hypothetical protein